MRPRGLSKVFVCICSYESVAYWNPGLYLEFGKSKFIYLLFLFLIYYFF